ncbi:hypothetical protein NZK27_09140 [Synechococcus sp. FGCU-3]|jgi:hypothetical protein|nr:hypothetical protein [Synechococcus sp. FGCU3]
MTLLISKSPRDGLRTQLDAEARRHEAAAKAAAERGDMEASARSILAMLDCERRLGAQGPQVMQVIKPRSATVSRGLVS